MKRFLFFVSFLFATADFLNAQAPHFNHATIFVVDMNQSADFYEKVMMFSRIPEPFHDNNHIWEKIGEHNELHIVQGASSTFRMI